MGKPSKGHHHSRKDRIKRLVMYVVAGAAIGGIVAMWFIDDARSLSLSDFNQRLRDGQVAEAQFSRDNHTMDVTLKGEDSSHTVDYPPGAEGKLYEDLKAANVSLKTSGVSLLSVIGSVGIVAFWMILVFLLVSALGSLKQLAKKNEVDTGQVERPKTRLSDVKGVDEVVARAREIIETISDPERFVKLGAKTPKGVIFYGPPGTGKILLARAIAGEAEVPFLRVTAASLMDMWLGSSAKRIAKLYSTARSHGKAIVFIDEIDAIGGSRSNRADSGADSERNAALTQLLNELDGFDESGVVTIVATNRPDMLDEALTRGGRFDIQLYVGAPDINGREEILKLHTTGKPLAGDVRLREIAQMTTGAVGADLEALANEAALTAARDKAVTITNAHFHEALATIESGPQRKGVTVSDSERRITAYHEAGHTLAALYQQDMDNPLRVTIVPRGQSGGHSRILSEEDRSYTSKKHAMAMLIWMMGGRAGEKIVCGADDFTSGASSDLQQATNLALNMVCQWGMGSYNTHIPLDTWRESPHAVEVERQVEKLLDDAELAAIELLLEHKTAVEEMVEQLLSEETIQGDDLQRFAHIPALDGSDLQDVRRKHNDVLSSVRCTNGAVVPLSV